MQAAERFFNVAKGMFHRSCNEAIILSVEKLNQAHINSGLF